MPARKTKQRLTGEDLVQYVEADGVVTYTDYSDYEPSLDDPPYPSRQQRTYTLRAVPAEKYDGSAVTE